MLASIEQNKNTIIPRFEFRTFGHNFEESTKLMANLSAAVPENVRERESDEIYILSKANDINNTKIRNGKMDIKMLVQTVDGFEQWKPLIKSSFPIIREVLEQDVFPAFNVGKPLLMNATYTLEEFLSVVAAHPKLKVVKVHKKRFGYMVNKTVCEVGRVLINGVPLKTISSESTELTDVKKTISDLGLNGLENINYLQAIKRVIGWINKPLAN